METQADRQPDSQILRSDVRLSLETDEEKRGIMSVLDGPEGLGGEGICAL